MKYFASAATPISLADADYAISARCRLFSSVAAMMRH